MKGFYVYMFLDKEEHPLYIGISINLTTRIEINHFGSENGNLSKECINETNRILYHKALSVDDMKIKERYLINSLCPKYNKNLKNDSIFSFTIDIKWKLYSIDKISLLEKQRNKLLRKKINYTCLINKTSNGYLPYGVSFDSKINYLIVKPKKETPYLTSYEQNLAFNYLLIINQKLYIHNYYQLSYYIAHYRAYCNQFNFDKKLDFLNVNAPVDKILFKDNGFFIEKELLTGVNFISYEIAKKMKFIDNRTIKIVDQRVKLLLKAESDFKSSFLANANK